MPAGPIHAFAEVRAPAMDRDDVAEFYDDFTVRQAAVGVNERHQAIRRWARRFGLGPGDRVLEIGCGIGTVTELLADEVGERGSVLGVDLSPQSIEIAQSRLRAFRNVALRAEDVTEMELSEAPFDAVILPDVIEHIPLALHDRLFERIASWVTPGGFVLLHYPNPNHLAWCHEHAPDDLQIIDQPIRANELLATTYAHGLFLDYLETYSIWVREGDYVVAVLRPLAGAMTWTRLPSPTPSLGRRIIHRIGALLPWRGALSRDTTGS